MQTFELTSSAPVVVSAYAASMRVLAAVLSDPAWVTAGAFYLPATVEAQLEAIGLVSAAGRTLRARLVEDDSDDVVAGTTVDITATVTTRALSSRVTLMGQRLYRIEFEVFGIASGTGTLFSASLAQ